MHTLDLASAALRLSGNAGAASAAVFALLGSDQRFKVDSEGRWTLCGSPPGTPLMSLRYAVVDVETTGGPLLGGPPHERAGHLRNPGRRDHGGVPHAAESRAPHSAQDRGCYRHYQRDGRCGAGVRARRRRGGRTARGPHIRSAQRKIRLGLREPGARGCPRRGAEGRASLHRAVGAEAPASRPAPEPRCARLSLRHPDTSSPSGTRRCSGDREDPAQAPGRGEHAGRASWISMLSGATCAARAAGAHAARPAKGSNSPSWTWVPVAEPSSAKANASPWDRR